MVNEENLRWKTLLDFVNYLFIKSANKSGVLLVEDDEIIGLYDRLIHKLFPSSEFEIINSKKISTLVQKVPKGGKVPLEKLFYKIQDLEIDTILPYLILFDGDFQQIFRKPQIITHKNVLYLEKYTFENYLIDESIFVYTLQNYISEKNYDEIKNIIAYQTWMDELNPNLIKLFALFAYCYKVYHEHHIQLNINCNCLNEISKFFKNKYKIGDQVIQDYLEKIIVIKHSKPEISFEEFSNFEQDFSQIVLSDYSKCISGKYYIHSFFKYFNQNNNIQINNQKVFRNQLITTIIDHKIEEFQFLKDALNRIIN